MFIDAATGYPLRAREIRVRRRVFFFFLNRSGRFSNSQQQQQQQQQDTSTGGNGKTYFRTRRVRGGGMVTGFCARQTENERHDDDGS